VTSSAVLSVCGDSPKKGPQSKPWTLMVTPILEVALLKMAVPREVAVVTTLGKCGTPSTYYVPVFWLVMPRSSLRLDVPTKGAQRSRAPTELSFGPI
jgi:hypothetical protein